MKEYRTSNLSLISYLAYKGIAAESLELCGKNNTRVEFVFDTSDSKTDELINEFLGEHALVEPALFYSVVRSVLATIKKFSTPEV